MQQTDAAPPGAAAGSLRGWLVVAAAFLGTFAAFGAHYSFAAFFHPFELEFGAGRAEVSLAFSICGAIYLLAGAASGILADRFGPRPLVTAGALFLSLGLFLTGRADSLFEVYLAYGIPVALGVAGIYVPSVSAVQGWFERNRGLASGLAVTGIAAGTLAMPLLAAELIGLLGWREAYTALAGFTLALGLAAALLVARRPEAARTAGSVGQAATMPLSQVLRTGIFWRLYLANMGVSLGLYMPFVHLEPYGRDAGLPPDLAVLLVGLIGVGSVAGRFLIGGLADRFGRRGALACMFAGVGASLVAWSLSAEFASLAAFAMFFGAFYGGYAALTPAVCADYFGAARLAGVIGCLYTSVTVGTLAGPVLAGLAFDLSGSYTWPILGGALAAFLAALLTATMPRAAAWRQRRGG